MIVGILSDTHDRVEATLAGLEALRAAGAESFIHCGDVGSERVLDQLAGLPLALVWGNTDWDRQHLTRYATDLQIKVYDPFADLELGGKRIAVTHGDDAKVVRALLDAQAHDYLLMGHTHVRADRRVGRTRVINPGALHRTGQKSVATLDTASDQLRFLMVSAVPGARP